MEKNVNEMIAIEQKLTKGSDSWSLGELVQAVVIMSHFHSLASFVFGCGIADDQLEPACNSSPTHAPPEQQQKSNQISFDRDHSPASPHSSLAHSLPPAAAAAAVYGNLFIAFFCTFSNSIKFFILFDYFIQFYHFLSFLFDYFI